MLSERVASRVAPFAAVACVAYALAFAFGESPSVVPFALSGLLTVIALGLPLGFPRLAMPRIARTALPIACFVAVVLLRYSFAGGLSGYSPLSLLPVLWLALYGTAVELAAGLLGLAASLAVYAGFLASPDLSAGEWRRSLVFMGVAVVTGTSVRRLVGEIRAQAALVRNQATVLRAAEERASSTRDLFAGVLRAATEYSIISTDPEGVITVFNEGAQRLLGYQAEEMIGRRNLVELHVDLEVQRRAAELGLSPGFEVFAEAARFGLAETRDWTYVRNDGSHVPVAVTVTAMRGADEELLGFIVIAANTTARRMERARTQAIIASQNDIVAAGLDAHTVMERIAARALSLTGASGAVIEMIEGDELVYGVTAGSLAPFASMRIARAGSISGLCLEEDRIMYCRDAEVDDRVDVETCQRIGARSMVAVPLRHHDTALGVVKVVSPLPHAFTDSDIETLELLASLMAAGVAHAEAYERVAEANARLVELDRLKDGFVATVSHELRTPLASIIAYTEMLTDGDAGALSSPQEQMVGAVERNSRRLHGLIEDLLTISKIEAGGFKTSLAPTELGPLVRAAGEALRHTAEAASLELRVDVAEDVGTVPADATQIDRALMNVLANAIKFSSPGGAIDLTARRVAEHIEIEVADEGIGIAAEDQERLFERFFRAASAKARAIPGSGLGLAIVKEIVEGHGGRVSIQSALGAGTRVTLRLPAQADASDEADDGQIANTLAV